MTQDASTPTGWTFDDWAGEVRERNLVEPVSALPGDRGIHHVLMAQSLAYNGGVLHAVESMAQDRREWAATLDGLRWLELGGVAELFERIRGLRAALPRGLDAAEELEQLADREGEVFLADGVVEDALRAALVRDPSAFAAPTSDNTAFSGDEDDPDDDGGPEFGGSLRRMARRTLRLRGQDPSLVRVPVDEEDARRQSDELVGLLDHDPRPWWRKVFARRS